MQRYFIELVTGQGKIKGEATVDKYKDQIVATKYDFGGSRSHTGKPGTREALVGSADFREFRIFKTPDISTPEIVRIFDAGERLEKLVLHACGADANCTEMFTYTLTDVIITDFNEEGSAEGVPENAIKFSYASLKLEYKTVDGRNTVASEINLQ